MQQAPYPSSENKHGRRPHGIVDREKEYNKEGLKTLSGQTYQPTMQNDIFVWGFPQITSITTTRIVVVIREQIRMERRQETTQNQDGAELSPIVTRKSKGFRSIHQTIPEN